MGAELGVSGEFLFSLLQLTESPLPKLVVSEGRECEEPRGKGPETGVASVSAEFLI